MGPLPTDLKNMIVQRDYEIAIGDSALHKSLANGVDRASFIWNKNLECWRKVFRENRE